MESQVEIIQINIAGKDQPGLTSSLTDILARYDAFILDIGQANILQSLTLGILIKTTSDKSGAIMKELLFKSSELGINIRFTPISEERYTAWVGMQGKNRYIITLLGRQLTARHIADVAGVISRQGLNIDAIKRMTGRVPLHEDERAPKSCIEFSVRGSLTEEATTAIQEQFMSFSNNGVDISFQRDDMFRRSRTLRFVKLKISGNSMRLTVRNLWYMSYIGFPALLSELAISSLMIVGNYTFIHYVGKDGVAAYSIACYIFPIIFMVYNGIIQSAQPIISYNYGAGLMRRGRKALRMALGTAALCGAAAFGFTWLCSPWIVGLFLTPAAPAYAIAVQGLPWFAAGYPFFGSNVVTIGYYQSIERGRLATGLTVLRGIVLMTFCFLLLPRIAGVTGIWLAVPVAEALETLLLVYLLRSRRFAFA